jgi:hypothetical protein
MMQRLSDIKTGLHNDLSVLNDKFSQSPLQSSIGRYIISRLSFRMSQCLEHSLWGLQRSFLSLLPNSSSTTSVVSPSAILSSSAASGRLDVLVFDVKGGKIWRSDMWSLGGAHLFACIWNSCIWNSCIALAYLISVTHELWLACNNLWDLMVWRGWELELELVDFYVMVYVCDFKLLIFWLVLVLLEFWR